MTVEMDSPAPDWSELPAWARRRLDGGTVEAGLTNVPLRIAAAPEAARTLRVTIRHRGGIEGVCVLAVERGDAPGWQPAPRWWQSAAMLPMHVESRDGEPDESVAEVDATFGWPGPLPPPHASYPAGPARMDVPAGCDLLVLALMALRPTPAIDAPTRPRTARVAPPVGPFWRGERLWRALRRAIDDDVRGRLATHRVLEPPAMTRLASSTRAVVFYLGSCLYPPGIAEVTRRPSPLRGAAANAHGPGDLALLRLAQAKAQFDGEGPVPLILAGDQVYVDATAGIFDPRTLDAPRLAAYRARSANPRVQRLAADGFVPIAVIDDHEVANDWEPGLDERRTRVARDLVRDSRDDFLREQRRDVPRACPPWRTWRVNAAEDFGADFGEHLLIVGDSRSERGERDPRRPLEASILDPRAGTHKQWSAWQEGLRRHVKQSPDAWRVIATAAMVLPRPVEVAQEPDVTQEPDFSVRADAAALRSDGWNGYPASLRRLLAFVCDGDGKGNADNGSTVAPITNCLFVGGDAHVGCVARADVMRLGRSPRRRVRLWCVHAPAMYAPFPFANGRPEDFAAVDRFAFEHPDDVIAKLPAGQRRRYLCRVRAWFPLVGDGFVRITLPPWPNGMTPPTVEFHAAAGSVTPVRPVL